MVWMDKSPGSPISEQLKDAQRKVVGGQIGDSSTAWQLVDPFKFARLHGYF